jgi:uroporphyrinogen-III synthase
VVGEASRAEAAARGLSVALVSPDGTGHGLWRELSRHLGGARRVCYPRSSRAEEPARMEDVAVSSPVLYRTERRRVDPSRLSGVDIAAVCSPSAVEGVLATLPGVRCASIGPTTSAALRARGTEPWLEASEPNFDSMAGEIAARA